MTGTNIIDSGFASEAVNRRARDLARALGEVYSRWGHERIAPPVICEAAPFLRRSGEDIRRRMVLLRADTAGARGALCLRPEITIPACRMLLAAWRDSSEPGGPRGGPFSRRLWYAGPVFRRELDGAGFHGEFLQAGVEHIGGDDPLKADGEAAALAAHTLNRADAGDALLTLGDTGLLRAFTSGLSLPARWEAMLFRRLGEPARLEALLSGETPRGETGARHAQPPHSSAQRLLDGVQRLGADWGRDVVSEILSLSGIEPAGSRSLEEIADRFLSVSVAQEIPSRATRDLLRRFLAVEGEVDHCLGVARDLGTEAGVSLEDALSRLRARVDSAVEHGLSRDRIRPRLGLAGEFEYYTGMVFRVSVAGRVCCAGGRYDTLLRALGADADIPAVGFAVMLDRLARVALDGGH